MSRFFLFVPLLWLASPHFVQGCDNTERLPTSITPQNYVIHLEPDMDSYTVKGNVMIWFNTTSNQSVPLTSVVMHLGLDTVVDEDTVTLLEFSGQMKMVGAIDYCDSQTTIKVLLPEGDELQHNQRYMIALNFTSVLYSEPIGLFTGSINSTSRYIASNFRPTFARNVFPCFDEPQFKTPVTLRVLRPKSYSTVSTAPLAHSFKTRANGMVLDTFEATWPISIHSLGLFMSELSPVDSPMGVTLYAPVGSPSSTTFLKSLLSNIKNTVGPFPIDPIKLVVLPDQLKLHLASYGFVFISTDIYGYNERKPAFASHVWTSLRLHVTEAFLCQFLEFSKTPSWWCQLWLSESVGAYLAAYLQPEVFPWLTIYTRSELLGMDSDNQTHSVIYSKIGSHWDIEKAVTSQSIRNKGLAVLIMWANTLPEGIVFKTIIDYIQLQKDVVKTSDFLDILVNYIQSNKTYDVTPVIEGLPLWLNTSGYPTVSYLPQSDSSFQLIQRPPNGSANLKWPVSVSFAQNSSRDWNRYRMGLWLLNASSSFSPKSFKGNQWAILNLESGPYRVDYYQSWDNIQGALKTDLLPSTTTDSVKATIQDDAVALSLQENLPFSTAFAILSSTQRYMLDWFPVAKAFDVFTNKIANDQDIYDDYRMFAASLFSDELLADLDLQNRPANARLQYIRSVMTPWLCQFNIGSCRQSVAKLFDQILQGHTDNIDPGDLENIACYGAQYNSSVLASLLSAYSTSSNLQLRNLYTIGLGCLSDPPSVLRVLNLAVSSSSPFATSDAKKIIVNLSSKIGNSATVVDFVSQQAFNIQSKLGSGCLADVLESLGKFRIDMSKIQSLINDKLLDPYVVHSALSAITRANESTAWWSTNAIDLDAALPQFHKKTSTTSTTTSSPSSASSSSSSVFSSSSASSDTTAAATTTMPTTIGTPTITTPAPTTTKQTTPTITTDATGTTATATTATATTATATTATATTATATTPAGTTSTGRNSTTPPPTVPPPPTTQDTTAATTESTPTPSSCPESLLNTNVFALITSLLIVVLSTST